MTKLVVFHVVVCFVYSADEGHLYSFGKEVQRLLFDTQDAWRITYINEKFK